MSIWAVGCHLHKPRSIWLELICNWWQGFFVVNALKSGLKVIHSVHLSFRKNLKPKISGKPIFLNNYCGYISFFFFSCQKPNSQLLFDENSLWTLSLSISVRCPLVVWWGLVLSDITVPRWGHISLQTYSGLQTFSKPVSAFHPTWSYKCGLRYSQNRLLGAVSWQAPHEFSSSSPQ